MRYCSLILHFYQPPTQEPSITKDVLSTCYLPLLRMLNQKSGYGLTLNISGSLILLLQQLGDTEFFDLVKKLVREGKMELLNSVMYHPIIPIIPQDVVVRQVKKNGELLKSSFAVNSISGFFPPELAIDKPSLDLLTSDYILVDQSALGVESGYQPIVKYRQKNLMVNNQQLCELFRSYPTKLSAQTVVKLSKQNSPEEGLVVIANDAELFGHHYSERLEVLTDLLMMPDIRFIKASEAVKKFGPKAVGTQTIKASTWQENKEFSLWSENDLQKQYLHLAKTAYALTLGHVDETAADLIDQAFSSCYVYWLSNWPWWHPGLVEKGATNLIQSVRMADISQKTKDQLEEIYRKFSEDMWSYHSSGKVVARYKQYEHKLLAIKNKWQFLK